MTIKWGIYGYILLIFNAFSALSDQKFNVYDAKGEAPRSVVVNYTSYDTFIISWSPPVTTSLKLQAYSIAYKELSLFGGGEELELFLPPIITTKKVSGLKEGTSYLVILSAVYHEFRKVPAPKFTVQTESQPSRDDVRGTTTPAVKCNCSEPGFVACTANSSALKCSCYPGYEGTWCETCAHNYYQRHKTCEACPCSNLTSTGLCTLDEESMEAVCTECLAGHRGARCDSCTAGYRWDDEASQCVPHKCHSYTLCADNSKLPGCRDCGFLVNRLPPTAQRSDQHLGDGSVPLIAVMVTLAVLLLVVAMGSCYRYWSHQRHRPRLPFWSVELQPDKMPECQYHHLNTGSKISSTHPNQTASSEGKLCNSPSLRTYNAIDV